MISGASETVRSVCVNPSQSPARRRSGPIAYAPRAGTRTGRRTRTRSRPRIGNPKSIQPRGLPGAGFGGSTPSTRKRRASSHGSGSGLRFVTSTVATGSSPATIRSGRRVTRASTAASARRPVISTTIHVMSEPNARTMSAGARLIAAAAMQITTTCQGNRPVRPSSGWVSMDQPALAATSSAGTGVRARTSAMIALVVRPRICASAFRKRR